MVRRKGKEKGRSIASRLVGVNNQLTKIILNLITNQGGILHLGDAVVYKNHNISPACTKLPGGAQFCSEKPNSATYRNFS